MPTLSGFGALWQQFFPPAPAFMEKDKLVLGVKSARSLSSPVLYPTGATSYLAERLLTKLRATTAEVNSTLPSPTTPSNLEYIFLSLSDLEISRPEAAVLAAQDPRLDIL
ncbi:hypothetical protein F4813DRAFT_389817 [Daldinia decipiens]|uniref:uncharacterized protein n=1 Tax=Daldinia decipiens TaxID=326647 RepID=UPI0020C40CC0|nr:uncharacterized protein F4813DRAFT_389817 [Daldinia decipiens]KAI1657233.1 hypothetical protein F4813DRAFT_389817 [Daldinia decipiens]